MISIYLFSLAVSSWLAVISSELTVLKQVQTIYDKSPKLRIRGSGFDADDHDIKVDISPYMSPSLKVDKDYLITKDPDGDGLILKLIGGRRLVLIVFAAIMLRPCQMGRLGR